MRVSGHRALIKLDIDKGQPRPTMTDISRKLARAGRYRPLWMMETRSRSGKGWHIVMQLSPEPRTAVEVVALQTILGSDPHREACNLWRAKVLHRASPFWRDRWNVLYY